MHISVLCEQFLIQYRIGDAPVELTGSQVAHQRTKAPVRRIKGAFWIPKCAFKAPKRRSGLLSQTRSVRNLRTVCKRVFRGFVIVIGDLRLWLLVRMKL